MKQNAKRIRDREKIFISVLAVLMALLMVVSLLGSMVLSAGAVTQAEIDKLKKDAAALAAQKDQLEDRITDLKGDKSQAVAKKRALDQQNAVIEEEIKNTSEQIAAYTTLVEEETVKLAEAQAKEEEQYNLFLNRVRVLEETGTVSYLSVLFGATSFSDLLDRAGAIGEIVDYDNAVRDQLIATREEIAATKADLEATCASLSEAKTQLDAKQAELEAKISEAQNLIYEINSKEEEYAEAIAELEADEARVAKEVDRLIEELEKQQNQVVGESGYLWPLSGYYYISSEFGYRKHPVTGQTNSFHQGVDIPAPKNTKILAARTGTVILSEYGSSYGNYVVLSHGNSEITLYAHMNSRAVKVGDVVKQGQVIGYVGTTGRSTGNHLHFEVRIKGTYYNPLKYYSIKFTF